VLCKPAKRRIALRSVCVCVCKNRAKPSAEAANERKSHDTLKEEKKREARHKRLRSIDRVRANKRSILLGEGLVSVMRGIKTFQNRESRKIL